MLSKIKETKLIANQSFMKIEYIKMVVFILHIFSTLGTASTGLNILRSFLSISVRFVITQPDKLK